MSHVYLNGVITKVAPASYVGAITPYTTIITNCTITSAPATPISSLASITVVVTYPDNTSAIFTQANGDVLYTSNGTWALTYNTKSIGNYQELWTVTTASNDTQEFRATYAVKL